jgi:hypothetical protein
MKATEKRLEYKKLDKDRVLVTAYRPGQKPVKTIVLVFSPEELEELDSAPIDAPRR